MILRFALILPAIVQAQQASPATSSCLVLNDRNGVQVVRAPAGLVAGTISSPFGLRKHPIFGFLEFHKGTDIAATVGSPVHVITAGVVEEAASKGTYGLYVRIRHAIDFQTAYAHLSALAAGIRPGVMVFASDVIGRVGSSGMSTGPHLHFEAILRGQPVDVMCRSAQPSVPKTNVITRPKTKAPLRVRAARISRKRKQP